MMYGQMTAGSWIYIGTQGILQGTYETFAECARQHFGGTLRGTRDAHRRPRRDGRRPAAGGDDERGRVHRDRGGRAPRRAPPRDRLRGPAHARPRTRRWRWPARRPPRATRSRSRWSATRPRSSPPGRRRASGSTSSPTRPPRTTRWPATSRPRSRLARRARPARARQPDVYMQRSMRSMADHVRAMLAFQEAGAVVFDYGNNLRAQAQEAGVENAFDYPGFVPAFIRPQFCEGRGPVPLGGALRRSGGHPPHGPRDPRAVPATTRGLRRWIELAEAKVPFQGLPARICWLGYGERAQGRAGVQRAGRARARSAAPIVIGRDHLDAGSVASPNRETEAMARRLRRGRRLAAAQRARQHRGRARPGCRSTTAAASGIGYSPARRAWSCVADGTELAARKLERVLTTDPGMGVVRHVDAGYERAIEVARERGVHIPMLDGLTAAAGERLRQRRRPRRRLPRHARRLSPPAAASSASGIVTMRRTDESVTGRNATSPPIAAEPDRRVEADQAAERPAEDRADGHRPPDDEAHRRVHPALHPRRGDRLAERDLVDVPGDAEEARPMNPDSGDGPAGSARPGASAHGQARRR